MRRLLIVPILLLATVASAGDWWIQAFGESTWVLATKGTYGLDIENGAISEQDLKTPITKPAFGGGLMIGSNSEDGGKMWGFVVDYVSGSSTTELALQDPQLGAGALETDMSFLQISVFFAGRAPLLSSDSGSWQGYLGGGLGVLNPMGEVAINYQDRDFSDNVISVNESASLSGNSFLIDLFAMEEWHLSDRFGFALTVGFRGAPYKDTAISTETMSGTVRSHYTGPYARLGLRIDL